MHPSALPTHSPARRVTTHAHPSGARMIRRVLTSLLLAAVALLGLGPAAHAHDTLTDSSPSEGETLDEPPTQVQLTFSAEVLEMGAAVVVADSDGATWEADEPAVDGRDVTVPLEDLPNGSYEISWRVTSSDGHPISGVIPFTVDAPAAETSDPEETAPAEATPTTAAPEEDTAENAQETSGPATEEPAPTTATPTSENATAPESEPTSEGLPWVPIGIGVVLAGLVAYAVVRVMRRNAPDGDGGPR